MPLRLTRSRESGAAIASSDSGGSTLYLEVANMASKWRHWLDIGAGILVSLGICSFLFALIQDGANKALLDQGFLGLAMLGALLLGIARIIQLWEEMNGGSQVRNIYRPGITMN